MGRTALVLSGGGLRGGAHIGALKVFERVGLLKEVQVVAGTSAGSIVGAMLASGTSVSAIEEAILRIKGAPCDQLLDLNLGGLRDAACRQDLGRLNGFLGGKALGDLVDDNLTHIRRFTDYTTLPPDQQDKVKDLLLVAVNLDNGKKTVFCDPARYTSYDEGVLCGRLTLAEAARASSSQPVVLTPFVCPAGEGCTCGQSGPGGTATPQAFVDGAVRENCPVKLVVRLAGCRRVLAVNLGYAGDRVEAVAEQGLAEIVNQSITIMGSQNFEADVDYLRTQVADGDLTLSAYVLNPRLYDMGMFAFDRLPEAIRRGEQAAEWFLEEVDRQLHIFNPDGTVNADRLFSQQGIFLHNYPDPERDERRRRLLITVGRSRPGGPCRVEQEILRLGLLAVGAVISLSLALFTLGGLIALRIKPNAAPAADVFAFWDGGLLLFLVGWLVILLLLRLRFCRPSR